jgi:hypothetical protein
VTEGEKAFAEEFRRSCLRHGVIAAYYIPRWTPDDKQLTGFASGGHPEACEILDVLVPLGARQAAKERA